MNRKTTIIGTLLIAVLIAWFVWYKFGRGWGIGVSLVLVGYIIFSMSYSMAGPTGWQQLFGSNNATSPKQPTTHK